MKHKIEEARLSLALAIPAAAACPLAALAAEGDVVDTTTTATNALTSALTTMAGSISEAIGAVLPIAIPLVGAGLVVTIGLSVFKRIANKA